MKFLGRFVLPVKIGLFFSVGVLILPQASAAPFVPGTGQRVANVGDDFEDDAWEFVPRGPKSSRDIDERQRNPTGFSTNRRWYEGAKRGYPDVVRRVPTPEGGLLGSEGSLLLMTVRSGIPGVRTNRMQQDDFICNVNYRLKGAISVTQRPSVVTRVFLPPIAKWENRTGPSFGFRVACDTTAWHVPEDSHTGRSIYGRAPYWPGMFVEFQSETDRGREYDTAYWRVRGNKRGGPIRGPQIEETGWWTLGVSFTSDGMIHYYAKSGVSDLTEEDHITSQFPYGYRCQRFKTFFFNVCNRDDGKTWSTPWIVDDSYVYFHPRTNFAKKSRSQDSRK